MDIKTACEILAVKNGELQKQIDVNNLALSILQDTFEAEFTSVEANRKITEEKVAQVEGLTAQIVDKVAQITTLEETINTITAEKAELQNSIVEKDAQIKIMTDEMTAIETPIEEILP